MIEPVVALGMPEKSDELRVRLRDPAWLARWTVAGGVNLHGKKELLGE